MSWIFTACTTYAENVCIHAFWIKTSTKSHVAGLLVCFHVQSCHIFSLCANRFPHALTFWIKVQQNCGQFSRWLVSLSFLLAAFVFYEPKSWLVNWQNVNAGTQQSNAVSDDGGSFLHLGAQELYHHWCGSGKVVVNRALSLLCLERRVCSCSRATISVALGELQPRGEKTVLTECCYCMLVTKLSEWHAVV